MKSVFDEKKEKISMTTIRERSIETINREMYRCFRNLKTRVTFITCYYNKWTLDLRAL